MQSTQTPDLTITPDIQHLITEIRLTVKDRLLVMSAVARYKWAHQLPIEDLAREKIVIENTVEQATAAGLRPEYAVKVVSAQINAAKQVQLNFFHRWKLVPGAETRVPLEDLNTDIRPAISKITKRLISQLVSLESIQLTCKHVARLLKVPESLPAYSEPWRTATKGLVPPGLTCD